MSILIRNIGQLVSMAGPTPRRGDQMKTVEFYRDGAIYVEKSKIIAVGPRHDIERLAKKDCEIIEAGKGVVTPGLVDAHTHAVFAGSRAKEFAMRCAGETYESIAAAGGGIRATMEAVRDSTKENLLAESLRNVRSMIRCGTTTAEIKSGYGLSIESEMRMLQMAARVGKHTGITVSPTFLGAHAVPPEFPGRPDDYIDYLINEVFPAVAKLKLAKWADAFCESMAFSKEQVRRYAHAANAHGLELRLHVDQLSEAGGASFAANLRAKTADHLEHTGTIGIKALSYSGTMPVLLPGSVYGLGHKVYPQARAMINANLPVVLATDFNPGSSPTPSLPMIMSLACTQMKMTPEEALSACTVNAAHSLDLAESKGRIEPGMDADIVIWDCGDWREIAQFFGKEMARTVIAGGKVIFQRADSQIC